MDWKREAFAIELDEMLCLWIEPVPTPQMG
jgi:hypothetical protein